MGVIKIFKKYNNNSPFKDHYQSALETLELARNRFDYLSENENDWELIEAAIYDLKAAELRLDYAVRQTKVAYQKKCERECESLWNISKVYPLLDSVKNLVAAIF